MVEINTPPAQNAAELAKIYLQHLKLAVQAARSLDLQLYLLSSYPLLIMPIMRDKPTYYIQARILGTDCYLHWLTAMDRAGVDRHFLCRKRQSTQISLESGAIESDRYS